MKTKASLNVDGPKVQADRQPANREPPGRGDRSLSRCKSGPESGCLLSASAFRLLGISDKKTVKIRLPGTWAAILLKNRAAFYLEPVTYG